MQIKYRVCQWCEKKNQKEKPSPRGLRLYESHQDIELILKAECDYEIHLFSSP